MRNIRALILVAMLVLPQVLLAKAREGVDVFVEHGCQGCHAITKYNISPLSTDGFAGGDLGSDTPNIPNDSLESFLLKKDDKADFQHPIRFKGTARERKLLVGWLINLRR